MKVIHRDYYKPSIWRKSVPFIVIRNTDNYLSDDRRTSEWEIDYNARGQAGTNKVGKHHT